MKGLGATIAKSLYITDSDNIIINSDNMETELKIVDILARKRSETLTINGIAKAIKQYYSFVHRIISKMIEGDIITIVKVGKAYLCTLNLKNEKTIALIQLSEIERRGEFLKRNKELKLLVEDFVRSINAQININSIVLFGSYANDTATKDSDIDLLLISKTRTPIDHITKEIYAKYGKEINFILMTPNDFRKQKDKAIIKEIIKNHYVLYGTEKFVNLVFN